MKAQIGCKGLTKIPKMVLRANNVFSEFPEMVLRANNGISNFP